MAVKNMGGETSEAWRAVLDDLVKRGLRIGAFAYVVAAGEFGKRRTLRPPPCFGLLRFGQSWRPAG